MCGWSGRVGVHDVQVGGWDGRYGTHPPSTPRTGQLGARPLVKHWGFERFWGHYGSRTVPGVDLQKQGPEAIPLAKPRSVTKKCA